MAIDIPESLQALARAAVQGVFENNRRSKSGIMTSRQQGSIPTFFDVLFLASWLLLCTFSEWLMACV